MEGSEVGRYFADHETGRYDFHQEPAQYLMKVETDNHPTAISPWPGAATGSGGKSAMKVPPDVAQSRKLVWLVSQYPTCQFLASNSRGKKISVNLSALLPRWTS
ncbi:hypothetical protein ACLK1Z_14810 [Escherichia coli]